MARVYSQSTDRTFSTAPALGVGCYCPAPPGACAQRQQRAFSAGEVRGMRSGKPPRGLKECQLVGKEVDERNTRACATRAATCFRGTNPHGPDMSPGSSPTIPNSHLGSFQHFPFVQDLHGKNLVGVSHFHDGDLKGGERRG